MNYEFKKELSILLNRYSVDNEVNLPDFILAETVVNYIKNIRELQTNIYNHEQQAVDDNADDAFALASAGRGTDEDYGSAAEII
jgi:hypothetical protein